jgi:hypothetical protein
MNAGSVKAKDSERYLRTPQASPDRCADVVAALVIALAGGDDRRPHKYFHSLPDSFLSE